VRTARALSVTDRGTDPAGIAVACVMLAPGLGGLEQSLVDYCEALLIERHPVHAVIDPRWAGRAALERMPLATIMPLANCNEWDPLAAHRLRSWLRAAAPRVVLTIGRRASTLVRRARRRLPEPLQVGVTPNYSLGPLIGLDHVLATTSDLRDALIAAGQGPDRITVVPNLVRVPPDGAPTNADPFRAHDGLRRPDRGARTAASARLPVRGAARRQRPRGGRVAGARRPLGDRGPPAVPWLDRR
jgi:hypothetical protein